MKVNYILIGDVRDKIKELPDKSVQMCVTSPPYYDLRNYEENNKQIGLEQTTDDYIQELIKVFAEVNRVLKDDGTLWINIGNTYLKKHKQLALVPQKLIIELQKWGWIVRQDIIWYKPNPMPESVKDRFTKSHEYIFLLSKKPIYKFNQIFDPIKRGTLKSERDYQKMKKGRLTYNGLRKNKKKHLGQSFVSGNLEKGKNKRSVWEITTTAYKKAHFATFPIKLVENCIKAGSDKGDVVLDCFMGSGTTAMVAQNLFRKWIGIELNEDYKVLIDEKTSQQSIF
tara:strand:- start:594 stop:1442 length:849 start_codon:yes stop_codon:yes gene_type:complete